MALAGAAVRLRRSLLYMPALSDKMVHKAVTEIHPDVVCMDCEDSVEESRKGEAREQVVRHLAGLDFGHSEAAVRINAVDAEACLPDLEAVLSGPRLPDAIVCPKLDTVDHVRWVYDRAGAILAKRGPEEARAGPGTAAAGPHTGHVPGGEGSPRVTLIGMCESAGGLLALPEILKWASGHAQSSPGHPMGPISAFILGGDDFASTIMATRSKGNTELLWARQAFVVSCRAYHVQPIDIVNIDYASADQTPLEHECRQGALFGFEGKQCIHPKQVPIVNRLFLPPPDRLAWAESVVKAHSVHSEKGTGAFAWHGRMIDAPTVKLARQLLERAQAGGVREAD